MIGEKLKEPFPIDRVVERVAAGEWPAPSDRPRAKAPPRRLPRVDWRIQVGVAAAVLVVDAVFVASHWQGHPPRAFWLGLASSAGFAALLLLVERFSRRRSGLGVFSVAWRLTWMAVLLAIHGWVDAELGIAATVAASVIVVRALDRGGDAVGDEGRSKSEAG